MLSPKATKLFIGYIYRLFFLSHYLAVVIHPDSELSSMLSRQFP